MLEIYFRERVIVIFQIFRDFGFRIKAPKVQKLEHWYYWILIIETLKLCTSYFVFLLFSFKMAVDRDKKWRSKKKTVKILTYFPLYRLKQKYFVITYKTKALQNDKTFPVTPTKRCWPLLLGIYSPWKSLLNNSKNGKDFDIACAGKVIS